MTLFNMMKRSKPRSTPGRSKSGYSSNSDFKPKTANVKQNLDKYLGLAREAVATGDRIAAEGFYQHAEHYLRLINDFKAQQSIADTAVSSPKKTVDETDTSLGVLAPESCTADETAADSNAA